MNRGFVSELQAGLDDLRAKGTYKRLNHLDSPQAARVQMEGRGEVLILSSNNYLGLCDEPAVVEAGIQGLRDFGAGTGSVRFICGTFTVHRELETALARFVGTEASMSFVSAWNANEGLTASIVEAGDFVISDALNHASIIDSIRLAKAITKCTTAVYAHGDLDDLVAKLRANAGARRRIIWTDGVFSMEGDIADLPAMRKVCDEFGAYLVVDDSHGTGVMGKTGRGTHEHQGLKGTQIDYITGTLGKALGGGAGGYIAGSRKAIDLLIQRGRPTLFSNALPCTIACSAEKAIEVLMREPQRVAKLRANVDAARAGIRDAGFEVLQSPTAICPIIVHDTAKAIAMSKRLLELGVFVIGFGFPVVPEGHARLRVQISAAHEAAHIKQLVDGLKVLRREFA